MRQKILTMLSMQAAMNEKVHPAWKSQTFAWYRAIWIEAGELLESLAERRVLLRNQRGRYLSLSSLLVAH